MASTTSTHLRCMALFLLIAQLARSDAIVPVPGNNPSVPTPMSTYIVHIDHLSKPSRFATLEQWYTSMVASLSPTNADRILYTYSTVMHGFAAVLTSDEARSLSNASGVTGAFQDGELSLYTTRSPGFLGLDPEWGLWPDANFGDGVIIGVIDTGIWPESSSFNDSGLGPVRQGWRGACVNGERFNGSLVCNNKLVGARFFTSGAEARLRALQSNDFRSPRDSVGHGTHVSSTAAGSEVSNANLFGFAKGTASGMAPKAKIAMYKACWLICPGSDVLAAIDAAVNDGVDIISMSLGGRPMDYHDDIIAIGTFGAVRRGVFVACAAGNDGPNESTVTNVAPWITAVGAGSVDRVFPVRMTLGSGEVLIGESLYDTPANKTDMIPLVLSDCSVDLVPDKIMGKVVVCNESDVVDGISAQSAGGSGLVALNVIGEGIQVQAFTLPALTLGHTASEKLTAYVQSSPYPVASFQFTCETVVGANRAPMVATFSSRGPSKVVPEILKPDVLAPGFNILAVWPDVSSLTSTDLDPRRAPFNIISGTSMACPHVSGLAALLRRAHPEWTPAMIQSAMTTTATMVDNESRGIIDDGSGRNATPLAVGAGYVRPQLAHDPGLAYDAGEQDYIDLMCTLNYTKEQLRKFVPDPVDCTTRRLPGGPSDLNYPSFVVIFSSNTAARVLTRTLTKVSELPETYNATVVSPHLVEVIVTPASLEFKKQYEKKSYKVEFRSTAATRTGNATARREFGCIMWESEAHLVKSPVVFMWN